MGPFIFLDTETTGLDASRDHLLEIACLIWKDGKILDRLESLVRPPVLIPQEVELLTGIDDEMVKDAPKVSEVKEKFATFMGDLPIIGHNIAFDIGFLRGGHFDLPNAQIDTVSLARILLRKEASYALEVLMKKHGLEVRPSHRAMADTETTVEFFEFLLGKIGEIPEKMWKEVEVILAKSDWAGKQVFEAQASPCVLRGGAPQALTAWCPPKRTGKAEAQAPLAAGTKDAVPPSGHTGLACAKPYWPQEVTKNFLNNEKILLESSSQIPFSELKNHPLIIAYSSPRTRTQIMEQAKAMPTGRQAARISIGENKESQIYLSSEKLEQALAAKKIPAEDVPFLLKLLLWKDETATGDRSELTLEREEYGKFDALADHEGTGDFVKKSLQDSSSKDIILIHHFGLARLIAEKLTEPTPRSLIVLDAGRLEDNLTFALKKRFTESDLRPIFGDRASLFFGLLGIFHEHFSSVDSGGFRGNALLTEAARREVPWQRVQDALANFPNHPKKDELLAAIVPQENIVQWVSSWANEVSLSAAPISLGKLWNQCAAPFKNIVLQSPALSGDGSFALIREILELDSSWKEIKETPAPDSSNLQTHIPKDFPDPYSEGYFKRCIKLFLEIIEQKRGKSLFLMSSKKAVEAVYQALSPKMKKLDVRLLGIGPSGGMGKSLALFCEDPANSILLSTNQILPHLPEVEDQLEVIVFQKIPFDPPDDPILSARSKFFDNGFEQYTLPRAVTKFREILAELGSSSTPKTCYLLDSRLKNRTYGRFFI